MRGGCRFDHEDLEGYVFGELGDERATQIILHLGACEACAREVAMLRAERRAFRDRADGEVVAVPAFAGVLEKMRAQEPIDLAARRAWWKRGAILTVAVAAAASFLIALPARHDQPAASNGVVVEAEPPQASCWEGEPSGNEEAVYQTDEAMASVEDAYEACLLTSPRAPRPTTIACCDSQVTRAGLRDGDDDGSCTSYRP